MSYIFIPSIRLQLFSGLKKRAIPWSDICEWAVLVLLVVSILWRGGKSLDVTWICTGVASIVVILAHTLDRKTGDQNVPLFLWAALVGFITLSFLSYCVSQTKNYGLDELLRTGSLGLIFLWSIRKAKDAERGKAYVDLLVRVLSVTVITACVIGMLVYIFQPVNRFVGTFFDYRFHTDYWPNAWVELLLMTWPIVLYWVMRSRTEYIVRALVLGLVFGSLFLSFSRGGILVFLGQLGMWCALLYKKTRLPFSIRKVVPTVMLLCAMTVFIVLVGNSLRGQLYDVQNIEEKVTLTAAEGTSSVSERVQFWSQATTLALQKPLLGWGPYSFRFLQPQLQMGIFATSDHPHNVLLKLFMERGIFVAVLFILIIVLSVMHLVYMLLSPQLEEGMLAFSLPMFIFLGLTGVLAHNMIDFNMQFVGIALPFWLLLGVLTQFPNRPVDRNVSVPIARWAELTFALFLLILALYEGSYLVVTSLGRHAESRGDTTSALRWYGRADGEFFTRDVHLSTAKLLYQEERYAEAKTALDTYFTENSHDYRAWKRQGDIALIRGEKQLAVQAYLRAFSSGKYNDLSIVQGLLDTYLALDDREEIADLRPTIDALLSQYAQAIASNTHFIALSTNVEQFIVVCNTLAKIYPDDAPRYQVMAAKADHHAQIERENLKSRPPGFLW